MKKYNYIGKADMKYLDRGKTKLGAFLKVDTEKLVSAIEAAKVPSELSISVLPSKDGESYNVKLNYE